MPPSDNTILLLAAQIVSAHVEHNDVLPRALPGLIKDVYQALVSVGEGALAAPATRSTALPPAPVPARRASSGQTVFDYHLICMDCGLHMKMLKRHLQTVHHLTPAQYRAKWNLAGDYPMVARQYATLRSNLAKESGLGKRPVPRGR